MRYRKRIHRDKTFITMAAITVMATAAIVGGFVISESTSGNKTENIADLNETKEKSSSDLAANSHDAKSTRDTTPQQTTPSVRDTENETTIDITNLEDDTNQNAEAGALVNGPSFTADSVLVWPVETNDVIIEYSPESTIYFATLDMYKTSDFICLRSEVGTPVYACADGIVDSIKYNEEIGNNITLNLGNNYMLTYGQIKDVQVDSGDVISEGDLICYVANPTKYYTVDGPNLFLKLTVDDKSVDPLDYLDFED